MRIKILRVFRGQGMLDIVIETQTGERTELGFPERVGEEVAKETIRLQFHLQNQPVLNEGWEGE